MRITATQNRVQVRRPEECKAEQSRLKMSKNFTFRFKKGNLKPSASKQKVNLCESTVTNRNTHIP